MVLLNLLVYYLIWHYSKALKDALAIWGNFLWFLWNYFSIPQLAKTLFVPWKRLGEEPTDIFDFFNYFFAILITLLMRIVGLVIRFAVIFVGFISIALGILSGIIFLVAWIFMPLILIIIFLVGFELFTQNF